MSHTTMPFIERVRKANHIERLVPELVSDFKGFETDATAILKCLCPFHKGDELSFSVYPREQCYHCLGCGRQGDVFDLFQAVKGLDFVPALDALAQRAGIQKPELRDSDIKLELERRAIEDILGATADFYHQALMQNSAFLTDLKTKKAWSEDTIREAKLGLAQGLDLAGHLASKGFDLELAKKAGVMKRDGSAFFEGRIVIPYLGRGRVVYMSGRAPDGSKPPKYLNLPVNRPLERVAYSADALHRQGELVIVEGFADALTLKQWGYDVVFLSGDGSV